MVKIVKLFHTAKDPMFAYPNPQPQIHTET